jgi:hypothetical protein
MNQHGATVVFNFVSQVAAFGLLERNIDACEALWRAWLPVAGHRDASPLQQGPVLGGRRRVCSITG